MIHAIKLMSGLVNPNNTVTFGLVGVTRGYKSEPHRAVRCHTVADGDHTQALLTGFQSTSEASFTEFLRSLDLPCDSVGCTRDTYTIECIRRAGLHPVPLARSYTVQELVGPPELIKDPAQRALWMPTISNAVGAAMQEVDSVSYV